jgi:hypothetical protein
MVPSPAVQVQGQGSVGADQLNSYIGGVLNVAQLRTFTGLSNMLALLEGANTPGDGGTALYYWNSTSTGPDNGTTIIQPNGSTVGAWLLLGYINSGAGTIAFPPLSSAPPSPTIGAAYFDTTLGYPRIYGSDNQWHGIRLT